MEFSLSPFTPVADRVWYATAQPASVNIGLVAGERGCLVIDTGSTPEQGRAIRAAAEETAGVPVVAAVLTHHHWDHAWGLAAFADLPTYAHATVARDVHADPELDAHTGELGFAASELADAQHTFHLATTVDLGGRHVEVVHFGPGHTPGDAVVLVPDAHAVFAGDLLENPTPYLGEESRLQDWPVALDGILGGLRPESVIVPGHGEPVDRVFATNQRGQLAGLYLQLQYLFEMGATPDDVREKGQWDFPWEAFAAVVPGVYADLRAQGKIGRTLKVLH